MPATPIFGTRPAELVGMKLEGRYLEKSALLKERERSLRRELFCDWRRLGEV